MNYGLLYKIETKAKLYTVKQTQEMLKPFKNKNNQYFIFQEQQFHWISRRQQSIVFSIKFIVLYLYNGS